MKFKIRLRDVGTQRTQTEPYDRPELTNEEAVRLWVQDTLQKFSNTLRNGEVARELIEIQFIGPSKEKPVYKHDWEKSNLITIMPEHGRSYDTARCRLCGATGKRYGLDHEIVPDKGFSEICEKIT